MDIVQHLYDHAGNVRPLLPQNAHKAAAKILRQERAFDKIAELLSDAVQCDCEHGVRSLNERATANYLKEYPATLDALGKIQKIVERETLEGDA